MYDQNLALSFVTQYKIIYIYIIEAMDNDTNSTISLDKELRDMMNTNEYTYIKTAVIGVIITLNVIMNSLVIAVIARYPQLREDRTTLFMFSLSVSDLAAGCTFMPISAVLCSRATPEVAYMVGLLPKVHAFTVWWFGFNSMYSLCWLTISKAIVILNPFKVERLLSHKRCYIIIGMNWMIGGLVAVGVFKMDIPWDIARCTYGKSNEYGGMEGYLLHFVFGVALPVSLIVYGTLRIFIVVLRTHRQIVALENSVAIGDNSIRKTSFVTVHAIQSSRNVLVICIVSLLLNTPLLAYGVLDTMTGTPVLHGFSFISAWLFQSNTFVNSLLYLVLFKSVRKRVVHMCCAILVSTHER